MCSLCQFRSIQWDLSDSVSLSKGLKGLMAIWLLETSRLGRCSLNTQVRKMTLCQGLPWILPRFSLPNYTWLIEWWIMLMSYFTKFFSVWLLRLDLWVFFHRQSTVALMSVPQIQSYDTYCVPTAWLATLSVWLRSSSASVLCQPVWPPVEHTCVKKHRYILALQTFRRK